MKDEYAVKVEKKSLEAYRETLEDLPSAQPERKKGELPEEARKSAEEYCEECNHIEMCGWYPYEGCEFRSITQPERKKGELPEEARKSAEEYCEECNHIEMCGWPRHGTGGQAVMKPNEIIDNMNEIIAKCQEFRKKALKDYQEESAVLRRGKNKMDPKEYRTLRLDNMRQYSEQSKRLCLMTIAACEAVIRELDQDNPYQANYKGGEKDAAKQGRKTDEGHGGRDPVC